MKKLLKNGSLAFGLAAIGGLIGSDPSLAQTVDFSKAEATGQGIVDSLRGNIATIIFTICLVVTGFMAAFNRISWFWFFAVCLGAFFVFASPTIVGELRTAFT